jgi:hypothetical protein
MENNEERIPNVNVLLRKVLDLIVAVEPIVEKSGDEALKEKFEIGDRCLNVLLSLFYESECVPRCGGRYPRISIPRCTRVYPAIQDGEGCDWTHPRIPLPEEKK